jgi:hypothetical protein
VGGRLRLRALQQRPPGQPPGCGVPGGPPRGRKGRQTVTRVPSKGPYSPFSAGIRTLLARTCTSCGQLADGDSFPVISGVGARRRACHNCVNAKKKRDREERGIGVPAPRPPEALQTNKKRQWSSEDDTFLRENLNHSSYEEIAVALGRSLHSVYTRRRILGLSKVRKSHRVEKPWKIQ